MTEECNNCPGYRFDSFMDDTYYCKKYEGVWDEFKLSRVCHVAKRKEEASASLAYSKDTCIVPCGEQCDSCSMIGEASASYIFRR